MSYQKLKLHLEEVISRLGMAVQPVHPSGDKPPFAYSVGQHAKGLPELIVFGLPMEAAAVLLYTLAAHMEEEHRAGRTVGPSNVELEGFGMLTALVPVSAAAAGDYATVALDRSEGNATFFQAVWPDQAGLYPWDPEFDDRYREQQPVIGVAPAGADTTPKHLH